MIENMFSTPVASIQLADYFKDFEASTRGMIENFPVSIKENNCFKFGPAFTELVDLMKIFFENYRRKAGIRDELCFFNGFFNQYYPGEMNTPHGHPLALAIAVYYIRAEPGHGDLLLHDPRGTVMFDNHVEVTTRNRKLLETGYRSYRRITPVTGQLVLFPAYVIHSVEPNTLVDRPTRLSIGMNLYSRDFLREFNPNV